MIVTFDSSKIHEFKYKDALSFYPISVTLEYICVFLHEFEEKLNFVCPYNVCITCLPHIKFPTDMLELV